MAGIVVLTAACSSGSSSSSSSASADTNAAKDAAFVQCMASHGVNVSVSSNGGITQGNNGSNPPSQSQIQAARSACNRLLPNGSQPSQGQQQSVQQLLKYTQCMRAHGVSNIPDPNSDGTMHVSISVANSPHYQSAAQDCRSLLPPGGAP